MSKVRSSVQNGEIVLTLPFRTAERLTDALAREWGDETAQEVRSEIYRHLHDPECERVRPCPECAGTQYCGCGKCNEGFIECGGCS